MTLETAGLRAHFAKQIIDWQRVHGRSDLPWQNTRDPYRVWLSEVMLQQTQVSTVRDYFLRFLARFADVNALARASQDEVLALWSGLGYYSRARNLHRCAQQVAERFGGRFPPTAAALATLPGIGRSTAAAIAVFCFGERAAILDGNVKRVLARVLGFDADLGTAANTRTLWDAATALLPLAEDDARAIADYTQGLMDLGAGVCTPRRPSCSNCPVRALCAAHMQGAPERYPVRVRRMRRGAQALWMLIARDSQGRVWLEKRPAHGIWANLYCLPLFESRNALADAVAAGCPGVLSDGAPFVHVLTHKDLHLHPVLAEARSGTLLTPGGAWFEREAWSALGLPAPVRRLLEAQDSS